MGRSASRCVTHSNHQLGAKPGTHSTASSAPERRATRSKLVAVLHHAPIPDSAFDGDAAFNRSGGERDAIGDRAQVEPLLAPAKYKRRAQAEAAVCLCTPKAATCCSSSQSHSASLSGRPMVKIYIMCPLRFH